MATATKVDWHERIDCNESKLPIRVKITLRVSRVSGLTARDLYTYDRDLCFDSLVFRRPPKTPKLIAGRRENSSGAIVSKFGY
jgi:hypothetical protein